MTRKRLFWLMLLILLCLLGWIGYRAVHQSALDHDLIAATATGDPARVQALLDQGADPNAREDIIPGTGWQHLLNLLLRRTRNSPSICPLSQVISFGDLDAGRFEIVRILLEHRADPNVNMPEGLPLSLRALEPGQDGRLLTLLLQHGTNPNTVDSQGTSLLMYAENAHKEAWIRAALDHGANPDIENVDGDVPLMWAVYHRDIKAIDLLFSHHADVNHKNKSGQTALTYAIANSNGNGDSGSNRTQHQILEKLLAAGADLNTPNPQGCSPFQFALITHCPDLEDMVARGADVRRAIPSSAATQNVSIRIRTQTSAMTMGMTFTVIPGTTPLMFAVRARDVALVRNILAKGTDVNARNAQGDTALSYAEDTPEIRGLLQYAGARQ